MRLSLLATTAIAITAVSGLHFNLASVKSMMSKVAQKSSTATLMKSIDEPTPLNKSFVLRALDKNISDTINIDQLLLKVNGAKDIENILSKVEEAYKNLDKESLTKEQKIELKTEYELLKRFLTFVKDGKAPPPSPDSIAGTMKVEEKLAKANTDVEFDKILSEVDTVYSQLLEKNRSKVLELQVENKLLKVIILDFKASSLNQSNQKSNNQKRSLSQLVKNRAIFVSISNNLKLDTLLQNVKTEQDLDAIAKKVDESYSKLSKAPFTEQEKVQLRIEYELLKSLFEFLKTGKLPKSKPDSILATKDIEKLLEKATSSAQFDNILQQIDIGYTELLAKDPKREIELKTEHTILREIIVDVKAYLLQNKLIKRSMKLQAKQAMVSFAKRQIKSFIENK